MADLELKTVAQAARWDVTVQQGSTWGRALNFGDASIANVEFRGQIRRDHDDSAALASFTFSKSGNVLSVSLTAAQTTALPAERLVYDIEAYTALDAFVARLFEGRVTVTPEVTR
jgi:hypothetical protein